MCILSLSDNILINNRQMMEESTNILCTTFCVFTPHEKMDVGTKTGEVIELSRTESDQFSLSKKTKTKCVCHRKMIPESSVGPVFVSSAQQENLNSSVSSLFVWICLHPRSLEK